MYLCCDGCGVCCFLTGPAATAIAADPPACAGCGRTMCVDDHAHPPLGRAS